MDLQRACRSHQARRVLAEKQQQRLDRSASVIQRGVRQFLHGVREQRGAAAEVIQGGFRARRIGRNVRQEVEHHRRHFLPFALVEQALGYIDGSRPLYRLPVALSGKTRVYFPPDIEPPIVLKESGRPQNRQRVAQMWSVRELCEFLGLQHLVIPKAQVRGRFIVEERLPLRGEDYKRQLGLYLAHLDQFTPVAEEMAVLSCYMSFGDMNGETVRCHHFGEELIGRLDNFPLYIDHSEEPPRFRLGLIDLEDCLRTHSLSRDHNGGIRSLLSLFPYHLERMLFAIWRRGFGAERFMEELAEHSNNVKGAFQRVYGNHLDFLRENKITSANPIDLVPLAPEKRDSFIAYIEKKLRYEQRYGFCSKDRFGPDFKSNLERFITGGVSQAIEIVFGFIRKGRQIELETAYGDRQLQEYELPALRTVRIDLASRHGVFRKMAVLSTRYFRSKASEIDAMSVNMVWWIVEGLVKVGVFNDCGSINYQQS